MPRAALTGVEPVEQGFAASKALWRPRANTGRARARHPVRRLTGSLRTAAPGLRATVGRTAAAARSVAPTTTARGGDAATATCAPGGSPRTESGLPSWGAASMGEHLPFAPPKRPDDGSLIRPKSASFQQPPGECRGPARARPAPGDGRAGAGGEDRREGWAGGGEGGRPQRTLLADRADRAPAGPAPRCACLPTSYPRHRAPFHVTRVAETVGGPDPLWGGSGKGGAR
jgi:hypothetical protein